MADEADLQVQEPVEAAQEPIEAPAPVPTQPAAPYTTLGEITARQPVEAADLGERFAEAKRLIESDDMLSEGDRKLKLLQLDVMLEERQTRIQNGQQSNEERTRDGYAKQYAASDDPDAVKATRKVVDSTWDNAVSESIKRRGKFDYGTALTIFETKMEAAKRQPEPAPIPETRPAGQTRTTPRGVRQAPTQPEKKMTVQEIMDRAAMGDTSVIPADVLAEAKR